MTQEVHLDHVADIRQAIQLAVEALEAGHLIRVPDECGWNLLALATHSGAEQMPSAVGAEADLAVNSVAIAEPGVLEDYLSEASPLFVKLANRCWPGPVILRGGNGIVEGLARPWPKFSANWTLSPKGRRFSCPADSFAQEVLEQLSAPALSIVGTDEAAFSTVTDKVPIELIIRATDTRFSDLPTVVDTADNRMQIERPGVVSERMLSRLGGRIYLFVCTGNTCRSPMAEFLFRRMLAERLNCREDELLDRGFTVISAGISAYRGAAAAADAIELLKSDGIDLTGHESQPITEELLFHCDWIVTMTRQHRADLLSAFPELTERVRLLSSESDDIPDPIGAGMDEYTRCRDSISAHLRHMLENIPLSGP